KLRVGEAAGKVCDVVHQVHGAIGFTHEHRLHQLTRRLWSWRDEFGVESAWALELGRLAASQGPVGRWPFLAQRGDEPREAGSLGILRDRMLEIDLDPVIVGQPVRELRWSTLSWFKRRASAEQGTPVPDQAPLHRDHVIVETPVSWRIAVVSMLII